METLAAIAADLGALLLRQDYRGYDPYDVLASPVFDLPGLRSSHRLRFVAQQAFRRLPVNIRPILRIPKGRNPVTLALALQGDVLLGHDETVAHLVDELTGLVSEGYSGPCWGYDFDWEARGVSLPRFSPTIVATGFVTKALFTAFQLTGDARALDLCAKATQFVREDLIRTDDGQGGVCWSYSPFARDEVLNASLMGARLCAQVGHECGDSELLDEALAAARFVVRVQRRDGSWPYAVRDPRGWVDHFHTGYVLDCLLEISRLTGSRELDDALARGALFYRDNLFDGVTPKYYAHSLHPIDSSACAQAIITLCALGDRGAAARVAEWCVANMRRADGEFIYRIHRRYVDHTPYMRWSTAWMYTAIARVVHECGSPV